MTRFFVSFYLVAVVGTLCLSLLIGRPEPFLGAAIGAAIFIPFVAWMERVRD